MTHEQIVKSALTIIGLLFIFWFLYGPWQRFIVDVIRQRLFEIRDCVFDEAANGKIAFDSQEYMEFRNILNGMIRMAERATVLRFVFTAFLTKAAQINIGERSFSQHAFMKEKFDLAIKWMTVLVWIRSPLMIVSVALSIVVLPFVFAAYILSSTARRVPYKVIAKLRQEIQRETVMELTAS